jgi:Ca2+-binding RTX toxin-like protein
MTILTVGPGKQYATLSAAIAGSHNGDTLQVQAGTYTNDFATINTNISLVGVGGMVHLVATKAIPNGKAFLVTNSDVTITNFEFSGAKVADGNGAGVRYQGGNLTINMCYFHDNQEGLLSASNPSGSIAINNSEFAHNGVGTPGAAGYGQTHNLYVSQIGTLKITGSYFHDAVVGHEIKSNAINTIVQNSRIHDGPNGTASYSIDLPHGGRAIIQNNVIEQGLHSENPIIIAFGEGGSLAANSNLQVSGNTILNDLSSPSSLAIWNKTATIAQISGNEFYGLTAAKIASGPNTQSSNTFLVAEPSLDTSHPWAAAPQTGNVGNDTLAGGLGADTMAGGPGNDTYLVNNAGDKVTEAASSGTDTVLSSVSFTLGANAENLTLTGSAHINGTGNTLANLIVGNDGANILNGGSGNDTLVGGAGKDILAGGSGADHFDFKTLDGSADRITDFQKGATGDVLNISNILHGFNPQTSVLDHFVHFTHQNSDTVVQVNADGAGNDFVTVAVLQGVTGLTTAQALTNENLEVAPHSVV